MGIHSTAIVHPDAELDASVEVGPFAIIEARARIGAGTVVGPHCMVTGRTVLGRDNHLFNGAQIGVLSQDLKHAPGRIGRVEIGDGNVFREYMTVSASTHAGPEDEENVTRIGSHCLFMAYTHIAHDCTVGDGVIMANCAALSGHVTVGDNAILGGMAGVHQFCRVGPLAFIGGMARVNMDALPFMIIEGHPARCHGPNVVGLQRNGFDEPARARIKRIYKLLYRSGLNISQALAEIEKQVEDAPEQRLILEFIRSSQRGLCR